MKLSTRKFMAMHNVLYSRDNINRQLVSRKKKEENSPALKMVCRLQYEESKSEENNCMNIFIDKLVKFQTRRPGYGNAKETCWEKLNLF